MVPRSARSILLSLGALLVWQCVLHAQVTTVAGPPPPEVQAEAFDFLNSPTTARLTGGARIPAGTTIEGDVAVLGGSVDLAGEVGSLPFHFLENLARVEHGSAFIAA